MFDQYIVCEENFRTRDDGAPGGVVEVRMPYYRGLTLSMVEGEHRERAAWRCTGLESPAGADRIASGTGHAGSSRRRRRAFSE